MHELRPNLRVGSLVRYVRDGEYTLLDQNKAASIITGFAPRANNSTQEAIYDVLLATDAYGVGVDLQDATCAINYDLTWTPVEPAQRAGRLLRFRDSPQAVHLYSFQSVPSEGVTYGRRALGIIRRRETLMEREQDAVRLIDLPTLPRTEAEEETIDLSSLAATPYEQVFNPANLSASELGVSAIFNHLAHLAQHRDEAMALRDDMISALAYSGERLLLFMLLLVQEQPILVFYDIEHKELLLQMTEAEMLSCIECQPDTPTAFVSKDTVELASDMCIRAWCQHYQIAVDAITRICALYLQPQNTAPTVTTWLNQQLCNLLFSCFVSVPRYCTSTSSEQC